MAETNNFFNDKEFKDNLKRYEDAHTRGLSIYLDTDEYADIAEYYRGKGRIDEAHAVLNEALNIFPDSTTLWTVKARMTLLEGGDVERAYQYISNVGDKDDVEYTYTLAEIMIMDGKEKQADQMLHRRFELLDDDEREEFKQDVATIYADYEEYDLAKDWFDRLEPNEDNSYKELKGRIALGTGNLEDSENIFQELIEDDPYSTSYWNNLAMLQFVKNNFNDSITSSEFSIAINPDDAEAILTKANGLFSLGNYEEALNYYDRYGKLVPDDLSVEMLKGVTLLHLNKPEEALAHFKKAEKMSCHSTANLPEIYQEIAFTLSQQGRVEEALAYLDKKQKLPNDKHSDTLLLKGHILLENEYLEKAQEVFQEAIRSSDNSPSTFLQIAISVYDCRYVHLAYKLFLSYFKDAGDTCQDGYAYFALCANELGKEREFAHAVKLACERNPMEAKMVLADLFPEGMSTEEYYPYLLSTNTDERKQK